MNINVRKFNAKNKLTDKEIKDLVRLLKKVRLPAPYPVFLALCKSVPMVAVDLAVMPDSRQILLTYRKDDFYDNWHIPGSILRYDEAPEKAVKRVSIKELGIKISNLEFVNFFCESDQRGYEVILLFRAKPVGNPSKGKYFYLDNLPKKFLKIQQPEIKFLSSIL